jgi:ferric-dicitrate binding protein FerR (iron transport regulator)
VTPDSCEQARAWMSDWLAGEIAPEELMALESHQEACSACLAEFDRLLLQDRALGELVGESLSDSLRSRLRSGLAGARRSRRRTVVRGILAAAAALLMAVGLYWSGFLRTAIELPPVAAVERVRGDVRIASIGSEEAASEGMSIAAGQGITTRGPGSLAVVRYADGTELEVGGGTAIGRLDDPPSGKEVTLTRGTLRAWVAPQPPGRPMTLSSPLARATVLGTRLRLVVDPAASTRLEVEEGKVRLTRTADGAAIDVTTGSFATAAPLGVLVAHPLRPSGKATVVKAGETLDLSEDLILAGDDTLEVLGTADHPCILKGNHHQIRTSGEWIGRLRITYAEVRELGDRTAFNAQGKVTSQTHALEIAASKSAEFAVENTSFGASSALRLRLDGQSTARIVDNLFKEDSLVWVDKARERSCPMVEASGSSAAPKFFQGNRIYRSGILITGKQWRIGGDADAQSNLIIGLRAALDAYGEGTVVRGNYVHVLMPRTPEYPYWSQVSTFTTAKGALAEHNVIRDGEWIVQFVEGEFRYNLICDINDHNLLRNGSTGRIHHNIFVAGIPDHPPGSMGGCIFIVYAPKEGEQGAEIWNNTFDAGGTMNVPGLEMNSGGFVKSLRNNVYYNFGHQEKFIRSAQAMVRPVWTEPLTDPPPVQLGYADYNAFYSPLAKVKRNYALGVQGKTERKDAGFAYHDLPPGGAPNDQVDPKFKGPIPTAFAFFDDDIKSGKVTVSRILAFYRDVYTPAPGSPLLHAGDPADGEGTDIGAVDSGKPAKPR